MHCAKANQYIYIYIQIHWHMYRWQNLRWAANRLFDDRQPHDRRTQLDIGICKWKLEMKRKPKA